MQKPGEPVAASMRSTPSKTPSISGLLQEIATNAATPAVTLPVDHQEMALCQILCQDTQHLRGSTVLQVISKAEGDLQLLGNISTGTFRPLVPACMCTEVLASMHNLAHLGTRATRRLLSARYV